MYGIQQSGNHESGTHARISSPGGFGAVDPLNLGYSVNYHCASNRQKHPLKAFSHGSDRIINRAVRRQEKSFQSDPLQDWW
jgi:hypothetical protein